VARRRNTIPPRFSFCQNAYECSVSVRSFFSPNADETRAVGRENSATAQTGLGGGADKTQNIIEICRNINGIFKNISGICKNISDILSFVRAAAGFFLRSG
jgi:hypothetical protein